MLRLGAFEGAGGAVSLWGLWLALLLALNGAGITSNTHTQLWAALVPQKQQLPGADAIAAAEEQLCSETHALLHELSQSSGAGAAKLIISSGLWAKDVSVDRGYIERMWRLFKTPVQSVRSAVPINAWTVKNTNGLVKETMPASADFKAIITTAVYFRGAWQYKFSATATRRQKFTTPGQNSSTPGKVVPVDMMHRVFKSPADGRVAYGSLPGHFRAVKLPFLAGSIAAVAVLPDLRRYQYDLAAAAAGISPQMLFDSEAWSSLAGDVASLELQLPKFTVRMPSTGLSQVLEALGVRASFDETADFSRIANASLHMDDLLQTAVVVVDEEGAEAAAATTGVMTTTAWAAPVPPLTFNRPFLFLIVDDATKVVLFMAAVNDPSLLAP